MHPIRTDSNRLCAHPPFEIEGTTGIAEMLLQSGPDRVYLLPALQSVWKPGGLTGFKAHGSFEIGVTGEEHHVTKLFPTSVAGKICFLEYCPPL